MLIHSVKTDQDVEFFDRCKKTRGSKMPAAHFHDKYELYFLESGKTKYLVGSEIYLLSPGDFIFVPKYEFHQTDSESIPNVERLLFVFDDDFVGEEFSIYIAELLREKHVRIPKEQLSKFNDIFSKIEYEEKKKKPHYRDMEKLYLRQLLILISRYKQEAVSKNLAETYVIINDAARFISENCGEVLTLETLSQKYALSPGYFSKIFKEVAGVGLNEYINISRITHAQKLLSTTNLSITKVAEKCGFNDSNYFAQVFKKLTEVTPKKYSMQFKNF